MILGPSPDLRDAVLRLNPSLAAAPWQALAGGRTNQVWRVGDLVAKAYRPDAATPLFPNDPVAEARALTLYAPLGLAPRLRAAGADWMVYDHCPGAVWSNAGRSGVQGSVGDPAPVALALGRLHGATAVDFRALPNGTDALRRDALRVTGGLKPGGYALPPLPDAPDLPPIPPRPVHGDAVAGNVILGPSGVVLIDWQCPGLGDPAEDLALFLSPLMQWIYTGRSLSADQRRRFLAAYPDPAVVARFIALEPLYHWRIMAHCAHRAARGDADYARALTL